jgi:TonB family protein
VAAKAAPKEAEGWYWLGATLYELERLEEAIPALERVLALEPQFPGAYTVAFDLGIAYSKRGQFERAVAAYEKAERHVADDGEGEMTLRARRATLQGNSAEALMALGRLDEALQRYREAIANHPRDPLLRWGLAVAYDRDEQVSKATQEAQQALTMDRAMARLTSEHVFFIPDGDIHYYFALGHLVQGNVEESKKHWKLFINNLPDSQWVPRARTHLAQLGSEVKGDKPRKRRLAPTPSAKAETRDRREQDSRSIRHRIQSYRYRFRRCYQSALRKSATLGGKLTVSFKVRRSGRASDVKIVNSTIRHASLHRCVTRVVRRIVFSRPASGKPITMTHEFEFRP